MKRGIKLFNIVLMMLTSFVAWSQPCLNGWQYRTEINVDNTGMLYDLPNHQVKLVVNTQDLVVSGKAKSDGSDLRFLDASGAPLSFWIENNTYNTLSTNIWIKVNNIAGGVNSSIYMFYGNNSAASVSSGANTFVLFDDFNGTSLNSTIWNQCGTGSVSVSGGNVVFNSTSGTSNAIIESQNQFPDTLVSEMYVNNVSEGVGFIGQNDILKQGWSMAFEKVGPNTLMKMMAQSDNLGECRNITNQIPSVNSVGAGATIGIWSFAWTASNQQEFNWPGGSETRSDMLFAGSFAQDKQITIGSSSNTGTISVDWTRVRQHAVVQPILSIGLESELIDVLTVSNGGPYCEDNTVELFAPTFAGATYNWVGPNGFVSSAQNPTIPNATVAASGTYVLTVTLPSGCSSVNAPTDVEVSSESIGGVLSSDAVECYGINNGTLVLAGNVGSILYWESSVSLGGPWTTINTNLNNLDYSNLLNTTFFRVIVQNEVCAIDTSNVVTITINETSQGGNLLGSTSVCEGSNAGTINLINQLGTINKWQSSIDNGVTWVDITNSTGTLSYTNTLTNTLYRVEVTNGVCAPVYSDTAEIIVNPIPQISFSAVEVCNGLLTPFTNTTTITSGSLVSYVWDFGDGTGEIIKNPSHLYLNAGTFNVSLQVTSDNGCVDSLRQNVFVSPLPNVDFSQNDVCDSINMAFLNLTSIASGTLTDFLWTFGDGVGTATTNNASYLYPGDGSYDVSLVVTSDKGCVDSVEKSVTVFPRAIVDFIPDSVCIGLPVYFVNTTQTTSSSINYVWNFGDGGVSGLLNPNYTYTNPGTYTVSLIANVPGGCVNVKQGTVVIYPEPVANFNFQNECEYDSIVLVNTSTINTGTETYLWDFGDGTTSNLENVSHLYATDGLFAIQLDVISDFGCSSSLTQTTEVYPAPISNFTYSNVCNNQATPFINTSSIPTGTMTYAWDFGDGQTDNVEDPQYVYVNNGNYSVQLMAESDNGCTDTIIKPITVHALPETNFIASVACDGDPTIFTNTTTIDAGVVNSYTWDFDDGSNSIVVNPVHQYLNPGSYFVTLTATSDQLCVKDTTIVANVSDFPVVNFVVENKCLGSNISPVNTSTVANGTLSYNWNFGDGIGTSNVSDPNYLYAQSGTYPITLTATSSLGCIDSTTKYVITFPLPTVNAGPDTSVSQGFNVDLSGYSYGAQSFIWSPTEGLDDNTIYNPSASPDETTTYSLLVIDENGCKNSDSLVLTVIEDYKLFVSNVVTPNGNGENDTWIIGNIETFQNATVFIYDRWGKEIYSKKGYQNDWDAVGDKDQLADGTYYYVITIEGTEITYKGALTVLRNK